MLLSCFFFKALFFLALGVKAGVAGGARGEVASRAVLAFFGVSTFLLGDAFFLTAVFRGFFFLGVVAVGLSLLLLLLLSLLELPWQLRHHAHSGLLSSLLLLHVPPRAVNPFLVSFPLAWDLQDD